MMLYLLPLLCVLTTLVLATMAVMQLNRETVSKGEVAVRLQLLKPNGHLSRNKAMKLAFQERILFPFAQKVFNLLQAFVPINSESWLRTKLVHAGFQRPHHIKVFIGIQCLLSASLFVCFLFYGAVFGKAHFIIGIMASVFFAMLGFGLPMLWLIQQAKNRQRAIRRSLPDFLDLLVVCVEAGLGLDMAISKITKLKTRKETKTLNDELKHYISDIGLGKPRGEALIEISNRTGVDDINSLVTALANSFEMGTSITKILRVHSETLRGKRLEAAKEHATKIPVKMVMPIYIFLFPAIFLTIFGPVAMILLRTVAEMFRQTAGKL
jgi:tight adherence protein C